MQNAHVQLIQDSFALALSQSDLVADRFYARLFQTAPATRDLFQADMTGQKVKLMVMLTFIVDNLMELDALIPAIQMLAQRHTTYGVTADHYEAVGDALLWSLEQSLGAAFRPEVRAAWARVYTLLANTMIVASEA